MTWSAALPATSFPGRSPAPRGVESFAVIAPAPPDQKEFVDKLERAFRNAHSGGEVDFIRVGDATARWRSSPWSTSSRCASPASCGR